MTGDHDGGQAPFEISEPPGIPRCQGGKSGKERHRHTSVALPGGAEKTEKPKAQLAHLREDVSSRECRVRQLDGWLRRFGRVDLFRGYLLFGQQSVDRCAIDSKLPSSRRLRMRSGPHQFSGPC